MLIFFSFVLGIKGSVLIGPSFKHCSYPIFSLDIQEFPSLSLGHKTETEFIKPKAQSRKLRLAFKSFGLSPEN